MCLSSSHVNNLPTYTYCCLCLYIYFIYLYSQRKYGKIYKNAEDEAIHKAIYLRNMREIETHNIHYRKGELPYWKEENEFTDLTEDEFRQYYRSIRVTCE